MLELSYKELAFGCACFSVSWFLIGYMFGKRQGLMEGWLRGVKSGYESALKNKINYY